MENGNGRAPLGRRSVTPHLVVRGAAEALAFYAEALGATELCRVPGADGKIMHATLAIGDGMIFLNDEFPNCVTSPQTLGGTPVAIALEVDDVDASFDRAVAAGAAARMAPADMFWGQRYAQFVDPFGHLWSLSAPSKTESVSPEEAARRALEFSLEPQPA